MSHSKGGDFISRLDLPYEVKYFLGSSKAVDLGDWMVEHVQEVVDAFVAVGAIVEHGRDYPPAPFKTEDGFTTYRIVASHSHEWRMYKVYSGPVTLTPFWRCTKCDAHTSTCLVPDPPEVPK